MVPVVRLTDSDDLSDGIISKILNQQIPAPIRLLREDILVKTAVEKIVEASLIALSLSGR